MLKSMRQMFAIYRKYRLRLIFAQLFVLISAITTIWVATLNQRLVNEGIQAGDMEVVLGTGLQMMILAVVSALCLAGAAYLSVFFSQGIGYVLRTFLYDKIQTFSFANFDRFSPSGMLVRLNADVINVQNAMLYTTMLALYAPFMLVVTLAITVARTPELVWLLLLVIAVILAGMALLVPSINRAYRARQKRLDALNDTLQENLTGVRVVKAFVREDYEIERFRARANDLRGPAYTGAFGTAFLTPVMTAVAQLGVAASIWVGGEAVLGGTLDVGQVVAFSQYLSLIVAPLAITAIVIPFLLRGDTSAERILEVYEAEPVVVDKEEAQFVDAETVKGRIEFEDVTFAFQRPDGELDPPALKHINLTIEPGQTVGFLGATGAGKTALVNLIPRFYDVTAGRITIDGVDVRDIPQENLRQIVGIALQQAVLFKGDIRFNLKFAAPEVEDDVMFDAAEAADAYGFVSAIPEQWEAPVAQRGRNFSGGQRQRLSISRTLTGRPRILILDDSTSALDASTEGRVQSAIPQFAQDVTTLYVAQRISAVIDLDKIVLLQNGEIVAMGSHEELLASNPLYQEIYESQLGKGIAPAQEPEVLS